MERILQYLDDLEDFYFAIPLIAERIRRLCRLVLVAVTAFLLPALGIFLTLQYPYFAIASAALLSVGLLYYSAVASQPDLARVS